MCEWRTVLVGQWVSGSEGEWSSGLVEAGGEWRHEVSEAEGE